MIMVFSQESCVNTIESEFVESSMILFRESLASLSHQYNLIRMFPLLWNSSFFSSKENANTEEKNGIEGEFCVSANSDTSKKMEYDVVVFVAVEFLSIKFMPLSLSIVCMCILSLFCHSFNPNAFNLNVTVCLSYFGNHSRFWWQSFGHSRCSRSIGKWRWDFMCQAFAILCFDYYQPWNACSWQYCFLSLSRFSPYLSLLLSLSLSLFLCV